MPFGQRVFELDGRDVSERLVEAVVVEPADVLDDGELELGPGAPHAVGDQLGLEASRRSSRPWRCRRRRRLSRPKRGRGGRRGPGCRPPRCIGCPRSVWATSRKSAPCSRVPSAIRSASSTRSVRMCPASCQPTTTPAEDVDARTRSRPRPPSSADTTGPRPTAGSGWRGEVALDQIGPALRVGIGDRRAPRLAAALGALDAVLRASAAAPGSAERSPRRAQRLPRPPVAVGLVVGLVRLADHVPAAARPRSRERADRPWRGGSKRTPTRPEIRQIGSTPKRSRCSSINAAHFVRSAVELGREKHRRGLQDLIRAAQLIVLLAQPP